MMFFNKPGDDSRAPDSAPDAAAGEAKESPEKKSVNEGMETPPSLRGRGDAEHGEASAEKAALAERKRVLAILDLARLGDLSISSAASLIHEGLSLDEARSKILEIKAREQQETVIHSHVGGASSAGAENPLKKAIETKIKQTREAQKSENPLLREVSRRAGA